ncbi:MAG: hypothetical protein ACFWUC_07430 [Oscillospiraceae bacterium]|jgi:transcriptional regulator with XRE-family HTH domain
MFYETLIKLCAENHISLTTLITKELGMSVSNVTNWKNGKIPRSDTIKKIASYFGVTTDYLLGNEQKEKPATDSDRLTEEEKKIIDLLREVPPEDRKMLVGMIEGALRSRGLLK